MKLAALLAISLIGIQASATTYKIIKEDLSKPHYEMKIAYPQFTSDSIIAAEKINKAVKDQVLEGDCGGSEDNSEYYYDAFAGVVAVNKNYIGVEVNGETYCGGANADKWRVYMTFDAKTGQQVQMDKEFPGQDYSRDPHATEAFRRELAKIFVANADYMKLMSAGCIPKNATLDEKINQVIEMYPLVGGLAKNKKVVLQTSPQFHAAAECAGAIRVDYKTIAPFLAPKSRLHNWLK